MSKQLYRKHPKIYSPDGKLIDRAAGKHGFYSSDRPQDITHIEGPLAELSRDEFAEWLAAQHSKLDNGS